MKKINLAISGCMGRMGQQLIKSSKKNKNFKLVNPSILLGDKINQLSSLLPHDVKGKIKSKKNKFLTLKVIKN